MNQRNIIDYNRENAVAYAHRWAMSRNPKYLDFEKLGGDCTNFASQVIFAGSGVMNYTPTFGWYYVNSNKRTPSWTGVDFLYNFLTTNKSIGPFAQEVDVSDIKVGDIIQLSFNGAPDYNHSPVVVKAGTPARLDNILIAAHTYDQDNHPITSYSWVDIRFIHIVGVRRA